MTVHDLLEIYLKWRKYYKITRPYHIATSSENRETYINGDECTYALHFTFIFREGKI
jgi:hypothetical protein